MAQHQDVMCSSNVAAGDQRPPTGRRTPTSLRGPEDMLEKTAQKVVFKGQRPTVS